MTEPRPTGDSDQAPGADHLDALISEAKEQEQIDNPPEPPEGVPAEAVGPDGLFTFEAFKKGLATGLGGAGHLTGLQTLLVSPEAPTFPAAAKALYETIHETPALHFFIKPGGKWFMRATAIGAFAVPVALGCSAELKARRQAAEADQAKGAADRQADQAAQDEAYLKTHAEAGQVNGDIAAAARLGDVAEPPEVGNGEGGADL
jgi:hypothetical protein